MFCYVYKAGESENSNLRIVRECRSPYFVKYGRSHLYQREFMTLEAYTQYRGLAIWNPATNACGNQRNYTTLIPWWHLRDSVVQDYRYIDSQAGLLSVRLDHDDGRGETLD